MFILRILFFGFGFSFFLSLSLSRCCYSLCRAESLLYKQKLIALELLARTFKVKENVNKIYSNCCCCHCWEWWCWLLPLLHHVFRFCHYCYLLLLLFCRFFDAASRTERGEMLFDGRRRLHRIRMHIICTVLQLNGIISRFAYVIANMLVSISVNECWERCVQQQPSKSVSMSGSKAKDVRARRREREKEEKKQQQQHFTKPMHLLIVELCA